MRFRRWVKWKTLIRANTYFSHHLWWDMNWILENASACTCVIFLVSLPAKKESSHKSLMNNSNEQTTTYISNNKNKTKTIRYQVNGKRFIIINSDQTSNTRWVSVCGWAWECEAGASNKCDNAAPEWVRREPASEREAKVAHWHSARSLLEYYLWSESVVGKEAGAPVPYTPHLLLSGSALGSLSLCVHVCIFFPIPT